MEEQTMESTSDDKLWAMLSWLPVVGWIIAIIVLLMEDKKNRPFIRYHAVNSLAVIVVITVTSFVLVGVCLAVIAFFAQLYWAYQAYQGQLVVVPVLTDFCKKQGWI